LKQREIRELKRLLEKVENEISPLGKDGKDEGKTPSTSMHGQYNTQMDQTIQMDPTMRAVVEETSANFKHNGDTQISNITNSNITNTNSNSQISPTIRLAALALDSSHTQVSHSIRLLLERISAAEEECRHYSDVLVSRNADWLRTAADFETLVL
jgi:hypothetical protein